MDRYIETKKVLFSENALSYYLLGVFITDGNVYKRKNKLHTTQCEISSKDKDWLLLIQTSLGNEPILKKKGKNHFVLMFYNEEIYDWLLSKGCVQNKSLTVKMPQIPIYYLRDFVRGCMDGDGSLSISKYKQYKKDKIYERVKKTAYLCGSSYDFLIDLKKQLDDIGLSGSLHEVKKQPSYINNILVQQKHPHYRLCFNDGGAVKYIRWVYHTNNELSLPRKLSKAQEILSSK